MNLTFILPAIGKKTGERYLKSWEMEPLTIAMLKALTPNDIQTDFYDDRIELINFDKPTDAVAISVETYTANRAYQIAKKYKDKGVKVILGGYHTTLMPDEALEHADAIVVGNAESVWNELMEDLRSNRLQRIYNGQTLFTDISPDKSIYKDKKYLPISLVETGRGCSFNCEFCAISSYYSARYCPRVIENVVHDIKESERKYFFFVDDNFVANQDYAMKLCKEIEPLKIGWTGQASLTIAKNKELLRSMKKSGCDVILIGFESLEKENLSQMNKEWNYKLGETDELVKRIHDEGISIYATFVFGFDYDRPSTFDRALEFSMKHGFFFTAFNHLLPFPGTRLYERLKAENRLLKEKWWLDSDYKYGDIPYIPKNMSPEELSERCADARRKFYSFSSIAKRGAKLLGRNKSPLLNYLFWSQNINLGREVDQRLSLPVGSGLDELPK